MARSEPRTACGMLSASVWTARAGLRDASRFAIDSEATSGSTARRVWDGRGAPEHVFSGVSSMSTILFQGRSGNAPSFLLEHQLGPQEPDCGSVCCWGCEVASWRRSSYHLCRLNLFPCRLNFCQNKPARVPWRLVLGYFRGDKILKPAPLKLATKNVQ